MTEPDEVVKLLRPGIGPTVGGKRLAIAGVKHYADGSLITWVDGRKVWAC